MMGTCERVRNMRAERRDTHHAEGQKKQKVEKWMERKTLRDKTNKKREKSPYQTFNISLFRCLAALAHCPGKAHEITHMASRYFRQYENLKLLSVPNIFSITVLAA